VNSASPFTVVVPVYNAPKELRHCLQSLQETLPAGVEVLLIDDASTDPAVNELFETWRQYKLPGWRFLANETNLGFVGAVNRGMRETAGDVVLLNSDTVATPGCFDSLRRCLASDAGIATATPWSNNGEIVSLPEFCRPNPAPPDPAAVARVLLTTGTPGYPEIPTAVGFCMAISRAAIERLGYFDEETFGRGYGEENDFCWRAAQAGMRNVLCDDAYVVHTGGASFGPLGLKPGEDSMARLLARHPDYLETVSAWIQQDPLRVRREAILAAIERAGIRMDHERGTPNEGSPTVSEPLEFTGERFTPECPREIRYEHLHRYVFAAGLVKGLRVLDAACGEGYGSSILARHAAAVTGVDISPETIAHAQQRYPASNIDFQAADCAELPFEDDSFDCIVSFETLEHLEPQDALLAGFRRVLRPGGFLLISTPDKAVYTDKMGNRNAFHVSELYRDEFEALLRRHFSAIRLAGQKLGFHSAIWTLDGISGVQFQQENEERTTACDQPPHEAVYLLALCAADESELPAIGSGLSLFDDAEESVYAHYHHEIQKNMAAGGVIAQKDALIERLQNELRQASGQRAPWWRRLLGRG